VVDEMDWGNVLILKGKYKGSIGYYDDIGENDKAIVYLGEPLRSKYVLLHHSSIEKTSLPYIPAKIFIKNNEYLAKILGVRE
jgi:hypothetical protein